MKVIYNLSTILLIVVFLTACNGKSSQETKEADSDSALTISEMNDVAGPVDYYLTSDSIGPVHLGEKISDLPVAVANLYDNMLVTETPDAVAYSFLLSDIPQFTVYDFLDGNVDLIILEGNSRGVETPEGVLRVGDEFTKLLALPGATAEWQSLDDSGIWYWRYNSLFFGVEETNISDQLAEALCDSHNPPKGSLFTADVKIGYIATGLPF